MPLLSLIVGMDLYKDLEVPDGCTVSEWKELLGKGFLGDKILYSGKLTCQKDKSRETLENAALLPEPPERMFVGGPGSVVKMLELALKKKLGAPLKGAMSPQYGGTHSNAQQPQIERRPSLLQESRSPPKAAFWPMLPSGNAQTQVAVPKERGMPMSPFALTQRGQATSKTGGSDDLLQYCTAGMQGMRPYMEDRTCAFLKLPGYEKVAFFGTFDGHGGHEVSDLTASTFPGILSGMLNNGLDPREALIEAFRSWDEDLQQLHAVSGPHPYDRTGSTAVVVLLLREERKMFCANCGDSRAVLAVQGPSRAEALSIDHKPQDVGEKARIEAAGGRVELFGPCWRIDKGLNVSRSLGDFAYKNNRSLPADQQRVTAVPDIVERDIDEDVQFVVMGSDGVFDVHSSEALVKILQESKMNGLSWDKAVDGALSRSLPSGDNVSICLFEISRPDGTWPTYS
mmetsp:Transcript_155048/g.269690  ORF Transcript_155048/g.269690 Transcript_155048/m.269690 type:complete len:456 (-) Transcript_155048:37-1404(-)